MLIVEIALVELEQPVFQDETQQKFEVFPHLDLRCKYRLEQELLVKYEQLFLGVDAY